MAEEDEQTFVGGSPNSEGVSNAELALVAETLKRAADGALVIVGLHAPLSIRGAMTTRITCAKPSVLCSGGTYHLCWYHPPYEHHDVADHAPATAPLMVRAIGRANDWCD